MISTELIEYFYSGRPYKVILKRLEEVHHVVFSYLAVVLQLPSQYKRLGLTLSWACLFH